MRGGAVLAPPAKRAQRDIAAAHTPRDIGVERMLVLDRRAGRVSSSYVRALPSLLRARDLLIVNDAATVPASLAGHTSEGVAIELRLASFAGEIGERDSHGDLDAVTVTAVLFGEGSHRDDTDARIPPPLVRAGVRLLFADGLQARVTRVHPLSPRLIDARFELSRDALLAALYRVATPIQYSYVDHPLPVREVQTAFASRPWAVEMPSAARPLGLATLLALRRRGVRLAWLTHAAGLSATGDPMLDRALPLPERYALPAHTVAAIESTRATGGRIVAVGTTVVRALEGNAHTHGLLVPGDFVTDLRIDADHPLLVVDGLLTNVHAPGESHHDLMGAFASRSLLDRAHALASSHGYLSHELGDATLIL